MPAARKIAERRSAKRTAAMNTASAVPIEMPVVPEEQLTALLPPELQNLPQPQTAIPRIAKTAAHLAEIDAAIAQIPTRHVLVRGDARELPALADESVHLVVTSPPYWTLKKYRESEG